jgi:hypothetical protein
VRVGTKERIVRAGKKERIVRTGTMKEATGGGGTHNRIQYTDIYYIQSKHIDCTV